MKILEKSFERKKFQYDQIYRKGNLAIYKQKNIEYGSLTYEAIVIKSHNGYEIMGNKIPPSEVYPCDSQWGDLAWTYQTLEEAQNKIKQLEETK